MGSSHGRSQDKRHSGFGGEGREDVDILLKQLFLDGVHPAAGPNLVVDQDDGCVFDVEGLGEVMDISCGGHDFVLRIFSHKTWQAMQSPNLKSSIASRSRPFLTDKRAEASPHSR